MKIGIVAANSGLDAAALEARRSFLAERARPDTEIVMLKAEGGPRSIESMFESEQASLAMVRAMLDAQGQGFDAFIPWCAGDPALIAGRERVRVPVVGPLQSACALAAMLGYRFSIVTPNTEPRLVRHRVRLLGYGGMLASVRILKRPVVELRDDLAATRALVAREVAHAAEEDEADAVVLACMALYGFCETLEDAAVPVIDPARAALAAAETLVTLGLCHAARTYPFPAGDLAS